MLAKAVCQPVHLALNHRFREQVRSHILFAVSSGFVRAKKIPVSFDTRIFNMVGVRGFELLTSCSQSRRATGLRYTPVKKRRPFSRLLRSALLASDLKI